MESFGQYLKNLRDEKGKTLGEIAENTKIAVSNLESLERDRYDLLPPRVFVKGFIRSYVLELGLDPDESLAKFEEYSRRGELPDYSGEEHPVFHQKPPTATFVGSTWFTILLTAAGMVSLSILLVTLVTHVVWRENGTKQTGPSVSTVKPSGYGQTEMKAPAAGRVGEESAGMETVKPQAGKKTLEIKALGNAWVRIEPDAGPAEELIMSPGDIQVFTAKNSFSLQTGNAGGIRLRYEGKELPPLGKVNQSLSLTLP
ncbi:MAG TPA: RodZ domain-containing protein [Desulfomonilaceae bacterium]|nr:RodZ domain-containing protein [Desulfomonilaceae bacterium]